MTIADFLALSGVPETISFLAGCTATSLGWLWKQRVKNQELAEALYSEALELAADSRDMAVVACQDLYETRHKLQKLPKSTRADSAIEYLTKIMAAAAQPNADAANEYYDTLRKRDRQMDLKAAKEQVKTARHLLRQNQAAQRGMSRGLVLMHADLGVASTSAAEPNRQSPNP